MSTWRFNHAMHAFCSIYHPIKDELCNIPFLPVPLMLDTEEVSSSHNFVPQPWQVTASEYIRSMSVEHVDKQSVVHTLAVQGDDDSVVYYNPKGYCIHKKKDQEHHAVETTYTMPGAVLFEKTGVGKTGGAVLAMRNRIAGNVTPSRMLCIVPPATFQHWVETIKTIWPCVTIRTCGSRRDLSAAVLRDMTIDQHTVYVVNKNILFKGSKYSAGAHQDFATYDTMYKDDANLLSFFSNEYDFLILDEAHEYTIPKNKDQKSTNYTKYDTFCITRSAYTLKRLLPNIAFTLLVTATPDLSVRGLNQILFLIGAHHTNKFDTRTFTQYAQYDKDELSILHQFPTSTSLNHARSILMQHHVVSTNSAIQRAVRTHRVLYTNHMLFARTNNNIRIFQRVNGICPRTGLDDQYFQGLENTVELIRSANHNNRPANDLLESIQRLRENVSFAAPYGHVRASSNDPMLERLTQATNEIVVSTVPLYPAETAFVNMITSCINDNDANRVLVYVGGFSNPKIDRDSQIKCIKDALCTKGITMDDFKGQLSSLNKKRKRFSEQTQKHIMMIGKNHLAGMNIPECTHIIIVGSIEDETSMTQLIGRARRYSPDPNSRAEPVQVIQLHPVY
jgi:hypothetical protein